MIRRPLRYPADWPTAPAQEKGIEVALAIDVVAMALREEYDAANVVSFETDLMPPSRPSTPADSAMSS